MNNYRDASYGYTPLPAALFIVTAGWLAFIALGMAASLSNPTSTGSDIVITIGAAVAAAAFALTALRTSRIDQARAALRTPTQSNSPEQMDEAA